MKPIREIRMRWRLQRMSFGEKCFKSCIMDFFWAKSLKFRTQISRIGYIFDASQVWRKHFRKIVFGITIESRLCSLCKHHESWQTVQCICYLENVIEDLIEIDAESSSVQRGCGTVVNGEMWYFGGYSNPKQVSYYSLITTIYCNENN